MKASELRIGNLIYVDSKLRYVFGTIYKTIQHNYHSKNSTYSENYENECEPIPLTEEWLFKFGFEKELGWDNMVYFNNNGMHIYLRENRKESWLEYENDIVLKSVHQLQNLYFALTNKELIINK